MRLPQTTCRGLAAGWACFLCALSGCQSLDTEVAYLGDEQLAHYRHVAEHVVYPDVQVEVRPATFVGQPRGLRPPRPEEAWPLTRADAVQMGLRGNPVIRQNGQFLSNGNPLLNNPDGVPSIFDADIQFNGVLFGSRGVPAAMSDYDPRLSASMGWGRDELTQNNLFLSGGLPPGSVLTDENAQFQARVDQSLLSGGTFSVIHDWNYSQNNSPARLFGSAYTGSLGAEYRQPLWAGFGPEVTGIAGPVSQRNPNTGGVSQGVVIAHINQKISQLDFESHLQDLVRDINQVYWELSLAYREYETEFVVRDNALRTWKEIQTKLHTGLEGGGAADEAQAEDAYLDASARVEHALGQLYDSEGRLRRLLNLPAEDERVLKPSDAPHAGPWAADRLALLHQAYLQRLELRKQKANIESLRLQHLAAQNLANPRLDLVAGYRLNGFGDQLVSRNNADGVTDEGFNSAYGSLFRGNQTSWDLGLQFSMPIFLRAERAQIRQMEFRLVKARKVLFEQEAEIGYELQQTLQALARWEALAQTNARRRVAADRRVRAATADYDAGRTTVDLVLRAQVSQAQAEIAYHRAVIEHNKAILEVQYRTGQLLESQQVILQNPWQPSTELSAYLLNREGPALPASPGRGGV
jgi:outer membrane protein TolC